MVDTNPARAIAIVTRIVMIRDFIEHPGIKSVYDGGQPVSMPPLPGTLGFDGPLWVGLGMVGLWAALDGFAERAALPRTLLIRLRSGLADTRAQGVRTSQVMCCRGNQSPASPAAVPAPRAATPPPRRRAA
jgi:hypothetical protein